MALPVAYYELVAPEQLEMRRDSIETEDLPGSQIAARTLFTAISPGTELAAFTGLPPLRPGSAYPRLLGYCNVAEVLAVGQSVSDLAVGDKVFTHQSHRSAFLCDQSDILAVVPKGVDPRHACVTYLFQLGYNALARAECGAGQSVGVIGLGALGLATLSVARNAGAKVFGFSDHADPQEAEAFGALAVFPKDLGAAKEALGQRLEEGQLDIVVTLSNTWADWRLALELSRPGGTVAVIGFPGRGQEPAPFNPLASQYLYDKQLKILGCGQWSDRAGPPADLQCGLKQNFCSLLGLVARGELPAAQLFGAVRPWSSLGHAYRDLRDRTSEAATYVLDWDA